MHTIIGIAGSLRRQSLNMALLAAAARLAPPSARVEIAPISDIPLYNGDLDNEQDFPPVVSALKDQIAAADGLLLVTPEYNHAMPGVLKNAVDWLSRPSADKKRVFGGKPVAIMGAASGAAGTRLGQTAWLPVFRVLGMRPWFEQQMFVANAKALFDEKGELTDQDLASRLSDFMAGFVDFAARD